MSHIDHNATRPADPVHEMGLRIGGLIQRANDLQQLSDSMRLGNESERNRVINAKGAVWAEVAAAEAYAMSMPCCTLAGAAVHIMLACVHNDYADTLTENSEATEDHLKIRRALRSALKVVANAAGLDLRTVGGDYYTDTATDPFPEVPRVLAAE